MRSFGLEFRAGRAIAAEILVNGALVSEKSAGDAAAHSLAIQQDVLPGANRIEVRAALAGIPLAADPRPLATPLPEGAFVELDLEVDVVEDRGDSFAVTTTPIDSLAWRPTAGTAGLSLPHVMVIPFQAPRETPAPVWTTARPIDAGSARPLVIAALHELSGMLVTGRLDAFEERLRHRNEDMARAFPMSGSAGDRARKDLAALRDVFAEPSFRLDVLDDRNLVVRAFAGGRLIECRRPDGSAALGGSAPGARRTDLTLAFSYIDGEMIVTR